MEIIEQFSYYAANSFIQAFVSTVSAGFLAIPLARGLLSFPKNKRWFFEIFCLLPSFLPTLLIIFLLLEWIDPFPMGFVGIVIAQTLVYSGFLAHQWSQLFENHAQRYSEHFSIFSGRFIPFLRLLVWNLKKPILQILTMVFLACWTSLAIPLVLGGGRYPTIEVFLLEKSRVGDSLLVSSLAGVLQFLILFFISRKLGQSEYDFSGWSEPQRTSLKNDGTVNLLILPSKLSRMWVYIYGAVPVLATWSPLGSLWETWFQLSLRNHDVVSLALHTTLFSLGVSIFVFIFLIFSVFSFLSTSFQDYIVSLSHVSIGLWGLVLSILLRGESWSTVVVFYILGLSLVMLPSLLRSGLAFRFRQLEAQVRLAKIYSSSEIYILRKILWPELRSQIFLLSGLSALWASGEFILAKFLFRQDVSLF